MGALVSWNDKQLSLIRRTVAKDCDAAEFDLFIHTCKTVRLDPLRKQIYAFVMSKSDPKKRQMTIVTSIGGYRSIAERTGNYRPGKTETVLDPTLVDPTTNPLGISHAIATAYKYVHGEWHAITETAYWAEFAPLKEVWENDVRTGRFILDPKKDGWRRMPRVMIEKCAEAKALRRGWPDDFDGLYAEDEVDRAHTLDLTATEMADAAEQANRLEMIGGGNKIMIDWMDDRPLQPVKVGQLGDEALKFVTQHKADPSHVMIWARKNQLALREYWGFDKDGALALKTKLEDVERAMKETAEAAE